jgi:exosortase E/protease (VPEID-CTERM system)
LNAAPADSARPSIPYGRWAALIVLIAAEFLSISLRFDAKTTPESRPWHGLVSQTGVLSRIGLAVVMATLLLAGPKWYRQLTCSSARLERSSGFVLLVLGNLAAFLCFFWLSRSVLEGDGSPNPSDWAYFAAWVISGSATLILWGLAVISWELWITLLSGSSASLLAGSALGVAAYMAGRLAQDQWQLLSKATLWVVYGLLRLGYSHTVLRPETNEVGTSTFQVQIAPECSGYEGMGLIAVLFAVALWTFRRDFRFPRALALLPVAMTLMWVANAVRITALVVLGTSGYPDLALGGFHSLAGWVFFLLVGLGLFACADRMPFFSRLHSDTQTRGEGRDAAFLVPAMTLIATAMVTSTLSPGLDRYYAARVIAVTVALLIFRKSYTELHLRWSWEAVAIGCGVFAAWMALEPSGSSASTGMPIHSSPESFPQGWVTTWLIFRVVGSVIVVPLAEELAFRGYLTRRLIASDFQSVPPGQLSWLSFLVSSVLFGVLHGRWVAGTLAGMAYALAYHRRGELTDAIVAHGVTNGLIAAVVLAMGHWSLWG